MAGDWIKMSRDLITNPKVVRISSALKADKLRVLGALFVVWTIADTHSEDGHLPGFSMDAMDVELRWPGFCAALAGVGWLKQDGEGGIQVPDFAEHNGRSAKRRAQETERKRAEREALDGVRDPSASDADKKRSREEKKITTSPVFSESKDSSKTAPDPEKAEIWKTGKGLLREEGMSEDRAGSFLGKLVKDYGQKRVLAVVRDCVQVTPAKPSEWITAACQERLIAGNTTWLTTPSGVEKRGKELGINARPGEEPAQYRQRVVEANANAARSARSAA